MSRFVRYTVAVSCAVAFCAILYRLGTTPTKNNVCSNIGDYIYVDGSRNCWYDKDVVSNATQIIANHGYDSETHEVTSDDGHIVTLFRVMHKSQNQSRGPVFLQHGLTSSSISFLGLGKNSLSFLLADAGYDVWLMNARGTIYSLKHTKHSARTDPQFWDHSFHEMGFYDIPAVMDHINVVSGNKKIVFVGYSVGTAQGLIYAASFSKDAEKKLQKFIFMSPVITSRKAKGFCYDVLGPFLSRLHRELPEGLFDLKLDTISGKYNRIEIPFLPMFVQIKIIAPILRYLQLGDIDTIKPQTFPALIAHNSHGASLKSLVHLFNGLKEFQMFDYGKEENLKVYGKETPHKYNVKNINIPVHMFYSDGDGIASKEDAVEFYQALPKRLQKGLEKVPFDKFTHMDFIYGANVKEQVYEKLLNILDNKNVN